jgi:hypothetical protein
LRAPSRHLKGMLKEEVKKVEVDDDETSDFEENE